MADEKDLDQESLNAMIAAEGVDLQREEEEADFDAGFSGEDRREASNAEEQEEQEEEHDQESAAEAEANPADAEIEERPEDAPGSGKNQEADAGDPLKTLEQRLTARVRNIEGRIGSLNRDWNQIQQSAKSTATRQGAETPTAQQVSAARQDNQKLKELKEEYPEWASIVEEQAALTESRIMQNMPKLDGYVSREDMQQAIATATFEARQAAIVDMRHSGWENTVATPEFRHWLMAQDENTKAFAESDLASDTIALLDLYTKSKRPADAGKKEKQQQRLKSAVSPTQGRATPRPAASTEEDDFLAAFNS